MKLSFVVQQPINKVFETLTDMRKFASVHPVISKIDLIDGNKYIVHETLKLGLIPVSFTYPITIHQNFDDKKVTFKATVMKLTKIEMHFELSIDHDSTIINETISIQSFLPIHSIMRNVFRKQHTLLFENINAIKKTE